MKKYFPRGVMRTHSDGGGEYKKVESQEASETTSETPQYYPFAEASRQIEGNWSIFSSLEWHEGRSVHSMGISQTVNLTQ